MNPGARLARFSAALIATLSVVPAPPVTGSNSELETSILAYHRFAPVVTDAMTVRTATFRWQLDYLRKHRHPIVPLHELVSHRLGRAAAPPPRSVFITVDDGHKSVFTEMLPIVLEYHVPVTLFVYPSAVSNASYAMTWEQLETLGRTGLFDIESHTYWHPNFKTERKRLSPAAYREFTEMQLVKSRTVLANKLRVEADLLAWPFGIVDDELIATARAAGYAAGFTLEPHIVTERDPIMTLPRFLVTDTASGARFAAMLPRGDP